jgi:hypothetical protein
MPLQRLSAQQQARQLFVSMPDSLLPYLTAVNRADCIDFLDSHMKARIKNRFGQESEMTVLSADYIKMQLSEGSTWQMKLLPVNDSTQVVCTVSTVSAPVADSDIRFYTTSWQPLPAADYMDALPAIGSFMSPEALVDETLAPYVAAFDMRLLQADLSADSTDLTLTLTTTDYVTREALEKLQKYISREKTYRWEGGRYK